MAQGPRPKPVPKNPSPPRRPKTAVVMIHGMGEQWPMETLRGFVQAVWVCDDDVVTGAFNSQIYSKPDSITGSFELRRITTRDWSGPRKRRVDFFEFYWAHMMQGNTLAAVTSWLKRLLLRPPSRVPERLVGGWIAGLVILGLATLTAAAAAAKWAPDGKLWNLLWSGLLLISPLVVAGWLLPVLGDAARYLSPSPGNVAVRQQIREAGVKLLTELHRTGDYDRIVLVGHSLGSVVGYDILHYAWGRIRASDLTHPAGSPAMARLDALEKAARNLAQASPPPGARKAYRRAQRAYFQALSGLKDADGRPLWLVSDYVTLGCPLSHADVLLAKDADDLEAKKALREVPTSPPRLEVAPKAPLQFSYPAGQSSRSPHHAAAFGPTVWTNIYFPSRFGLLGDFISGRVAPLLGRGVLDVEVPIGDPPGFRHLAYWSQPRSRQPWIRALRRAVNLRGRDEDALWGDQADAETIWAEKLP